MACARAMARQTRRRGATAASCGGNAAAAPRSADPGAQQPARNARHALSASGRRAARLTQSMHARRRSSATRACMGHPEGVRFRMSSSRSTASGSAAAFGAAMLPCDSAGERRTGRGAPRLRQHTRRLPRTCWRIWPASDTSVALRRARMAAAEAGEDCGASSLYDEDVDGAAAAALLLRVPGSKRDYADAHFWRRRYAGEVSAAGDGAGGAKRLLYDWCAARHGAVRIAARSGAHQARDCSANAGARSAAQRLRSAADCYQHSSTVCTAERRWRRRSARRAGTTSATRRSLRAWAPSDAATSCCRRGGTLPSFLALSLGPHAPPRRRVAARRSAAAPARGAAGSRTPAAS